MWVNSIRKDAIYEYTTRSASMHVKDIETKQIYEKNNEYKIKE